MWEFAWRLFVGLSISFAAGIILSSAVQCILKIRRGVKMGKKQSNPRPEEVGAIRPSPPPGSRKVSETPQKQDCLWESHPKGRTCACPGYFSVFPTLDQLCLCHRCMDTKEESTSSIQGKEIQKLLLAEYLDLLI